MERPEHVPRVPHCPLHMSLLPLRSSPLSMTERESHRHKPLLPTPQPLQSVFLNQDLKRLAAAQAGSAAALRLPAGAGPLRVTACIPNKLPGGSSRLCQELPWIRTSAQPRGSCAHLFAPVSSPATCT